MFNENVSGCKKSCTVTCRKRKSCCTLLGLLMCKKHQLSHVRICSFTCFSILFVSHGQILSFSSHTATVALRRCVHFHTWVSHVQSGQLYCSYNVFMSIRQHVGLCQTITWSNYLSFACKQGERFVFFIAKMEGTFVICKYKANDSQGTMLLAYILAHV